MKKRTTTQKPGVLAKKYAAAQAAKRKGPCGKPKQHPPRGAATKKPAPKHNAPEDEEEDDVEVDEEDRAFVEEHSAFAASLLSLAPDAAKDKRKDKKKDPMPAPPKPPAAVEPKKKNKRAHPEGQDDDDSEEVTIETKAMRRNASTQGWDTARGAGNKVMKERLPTKTIDGTIQFRTEEVEEEKEEAQTVVEMEVAAHLQEEPQPQDGEEKDREEDEDEDEEDYDDDGSVADSDASESEVISQHMRNAKGKNDDKDNVLSSGRLAAVASSLSLEAFGGDMRALRRARLELKKVEIATLCEAMLEDPETGLLSRSGSGGGKGKGSRMAALLSLLEDDDVKVQALAMASLLAVFRDLAPAYRIRLPTEKELQVKASKEVKQTREYERTLLSSYQAYLKHLEKASKKQTTASGKKITAEGNFSTPNVLVDVSSSVAAKCLCELLTALAHFNFTTNVLAAVIRLGLGPDPATRAMAGQAVRRLLERDQQGDVSLTATKLVCKEVQNRQLHAPDDMVRALQALKLRVKEDEADEVMRKAKMEAKKRKNKHSKETAEEAEEEGQGEIMAGL
jgi:nucleolar complex protein 3